MDQELATVITQVSPERARELLACMKLMLDLERVGDLVASFAERSAIVRNRIDMDDVEQLTRMGCLLENMLSTMLRAFAARDVDQAIRVLRTDSEVDRLRSNHSAMLVLGNDKKDRWTMVSGLNPASAIARAIRRVVDA